MAVKSKSEEIEKIIIGLLENNKAMSVDELVNEIFEKNRIYEREVKEAMWDLLEKGKIIPNKQWKMKIASSASSQK